MSIHFRLNVIWTLKRRQKYRTSDHHSFITKSKISFIWLCRLNMSIHLRLNVIYEPWNDVKPTKHFDHLNIITKSEISLKIVYTIIKTIQSLIKNSAHWNNTYYETINQTRMLTSHRIHSRKKWYSGISLKRKASMQKLLSVLIEISSFYMVYFILD